MGDWNFQIVNFGLDVFLTFFPCVYINTLKSELSTAKTYELISTDEKSVAKKRCKDIVTKFAVGITESQERIPRFIGYQNFINDLKRLV